MWTATGITIDCLVLHFELQSKFPLRDVLRIRQREKQTLETVVDFLVAQLVGFLLHWSEAGEDVPFRVQNHNQIVYLTITSLFAPRRGVTATFLSVVQSHSTSSVLPCWSYAEDQTMKRGTRI
jgi:hypothetical protein